MKAVFLDWATMGPNLDTGELRALLPELELFDVTADDEVAERIRGAAFVLTNKIKLSDELLNHCPGLRFIGLTATGTDNIDLEAAARHGVAVCNIRAYCTQSVAEHVFGVLLQLTHSLGRYAADVRSGKWQRSDNFCLLTHPVRELSAMTLGIVGYGELGKGVAKTAATFGMEVIVAARPGTSEERDDRVSFATLLARSDVISLHCPLNDDTRNLFGAEEFRKMKRDAILINTARGGLIDSAALAEALRTGQIAAAAIDVLPKEPPVQGDPLLDYEGDNLIITPHIAWATNEARQAAVDELTANVAAFMAGRQRNRVV
ncbi:MAG: D-2-hydroxyacid dehydrogenase [Gammaproteobacteria bacterium]|nr:D-2-hydroxyacid dehydrogenase [Gammaproteobacteria bacterium]MDH3362117.1 D-2-hydroxyacid dehydrogenase [Gammaproteobacteria bacterium]MDH3481759.1 D-2-hydroxyacid dehydrogenase [Gammaproteobacteria bacterium]